MNDQFASGGLVGFLTAVVTVIGAVLEGARRKRKKDKGETEVDPLTQRDELLTIQVNELINPLRESLNDARIELKDLRKENLETKLRVTTAESKIEQLEKTNSGLVSFIYHLLGILRHHDLMTEIKQDLPTGISL